MNVPRLKMTISLHALWLRNICLFAKSIVSGGNKLLLVMCVDCSDLLLSEKHQWFYLLFVSDRKNKKKQKKTKKNPSESTAPRIYFPEIVFSENVAESTWLSALWSGKYFTRDAAAAFTGNGRGNSFKLILWAVLNPDLTPPSDVNLCPGH